MPLTGEHKKLLVSRHAVARTEAERVPCRYCKTPTAMLGTRECDWCHNVSVNVRTMSPVVLSKIISETMPLQSRRELAVALLAANLAEKGVTK